MKARDVFAAGRSGKRRNLLLMGAVLALSVVAAIGSSASSAGADEGCPNEAIRVAQQSTQAGECRAWEMVSPPDKNYGNVIAEKSGEIEAARSGESVTFDSISGFADTIGSGTAGHIRYLARRGADGWSTHSVTPQPQPETVQVLYASNRVELFSEELDRAFVWAYDLPAVTDDEPFKENVYSEDTATGGLRTVSISHQDELTLLDFLSTRSVGVSADAKHIAFIPTLGTRMLPEAPAGRSIYQWDDGVLRLASILPDGSPAENPTAAFDEKSRLTMSADGSRLAFTAGGQLYLRIDNQRTDLITQSENGAFTEEAHGVFFEGMTPDGKNVFFVTESPLLPEDEVPGPDLYRWTDGPAPEHDLTLITRNGGAQSDPATTGGALIGMSDDATRVYVHDVGGFLELWEEGGGIKTIDPNVARLADSRLSLMASLPGNGRVSPDGNWLAYLTDNELRLYDRGRDATTTIAGGVSVDPKLTLAGINSQLPSYRPRFLSSGGKVFFNTAEALLPGDTNGVADVYEYDGETGQLSLLSSGKGSEPMMVADASADGKDVFFATRQRLLPSDRDENIDVYDARVGGGFDEPEAPVGGPCAGEACQAAGGAPAPAPAISSRPHTRGNVRSNRRCRHARRAVRTHHKIRCVKHRSGRHGHHGRHARAAAEVAK